MGVFNKRVRELKRKYSQLDITQTWVIYADILQR